MKVAIIGDGWVGKSMQRLFPDAYVYTHRNGAKKEKVNEADIAFICVPTPLKHVVENTKIPNSIGYKTVEILNTSIVEECIKWCECDLLVIRSTVNPGDCDRWSKQYKKHIVMQPEYLGETPNHPLIEEGQTPFIIFGGEKEDIRKVIDLYTIVYNANTRIRQVSLLEAEIIKLTENRAIAFKVMQIHELYKVCEKAGIDFYTIRDAVYGDDPRFNLWFTFIYANNLGFHSSKCLSKDVPAWCTWAESFGEFPEITKLLVRKSEEYSEQNEKL